MTMTELKGGLISRCIIVELDVDPQIPRKKTDKTVPEELIAALRRLDGGKDKPPGERGYQTGGNLTSRPISVQAPMSEGAMALYDEWLSRYVNLQARYKNDPDGRDILYSRISEQGGKIALIHAASRIGEVPASVELEDVEWATEFMDWTAKQYIARVVENVSWTRQDAFRRRVLKFLRELPEDVGSLKADVFALAEDLTSNGAEEAIRLMTSKGEIDQITVRRSRTNLEGLLYRLGERAGGKALPGKTILRIYKKGKK
jgi:hypothetical protein